MSLYIALLLVMPAVLSIDGDILRALDIILRKMPWGNGKGYALASAYRVSKIHKLTTEDDESNLFAHCSQFVREVVVVWWRYWCRWIVCWMMEPRVIR